MNTYKLAMIQMLVEGGNLKANLHRASEKISEAAGNGACIALLPEMMDTGWTHPSTKTMAGEIPEGETCVALRNSARDNAIYVCAGMAERDGDNIYNAAVIIDPSGVVIHKHRKLNELDIAHDLYGQGGGLSVVRTEIGTLGMYICADAFAVDNALSKSLGYMGADIIISPCAWAVPPGFDNEKTPYGEIWRQSYSEVAKKFNIWVVGVSNVGKIEKGPWRGWDCIGNSLAFAPGGKEVVTAPHGRCAETIAYLDVTMTKRPARGASWEELW